MDSVQGGIGDVRIAVTYGPMCLQRSAEETWADPRTGSEIGWRRIVKGLRKRGHTVEWHTDKESLRLTHGGLGCDVVLSINEPDMLREPPKTTDRFWEGHLITRAEKDRWLYGTPLRICMFWLNEFSFCKEGFDDHVDAYFSPSEAHRQKAIGSWGAPRPEKWHTNRLGCDIPARLAGRVPGRVAYCSSPDRGLHRVLEAWPAIRRAVPHAHLRVFYRLDPWLRSFDTTPYFPPIEKNRTRALYIEEALKRLSGPEWGVEVVDSVSRDTLQLELQQAEVFLHPCETVSWSEGFSCSTMEACANGAAPVVSDCDALGEVYAPLDPFRTGDWAAFTERTIRALKDREFREDLSARAVALAKEHTWDRHVQQLHEFLTARS